MFILKVVLIQFWITFKKKFHLLPKTLTETTVRSFHQIFNHISLTGCSWWKGIHNYQEYSQSFTRNSHTLSPEILTPFHQKYQHSFTWHAHLVRKPGQMCRLCSLWLFSKNIVYYVWYLQNELSLRKKGINMQTHK